MRRLRGLLVNDASLSGHHGSALVTDQAVRLAENAGIDLAARWDWEPVEKTLADPAARRAFDLVIVNGEGSIHHEAKAAVRIAKMATALKACGLPAYLINATVEETPPDVTMALGAFRRVYLRDRESAAFLAASNIGSKVVPDLTLSFDAAPRAQGSGTVLVTDSSDTGKTVALLALADKWPDATPITMRAEPPWPDRGSARRRWSFEAKRLLSRPLPLSPWSLRYAGALRTRDELLNVLTQQARAMVCGRYHAVCYALLTRLPFVAVAGNTSKVASLLHDVGLSSRHGTIEAVAGASPEGMIPPFTPAETARIDEFLERARVDAAEMFKVIARDAVQ